jgi:AcrR family transcriptional regulator
MRGLKRKVYRKDEGLKVTDRSRERVLAILRSAFEVLHQEGFDRVNFESVGARCGMRRSHVAYYFKSREDLLESVFRFVAQSAQERVIQEMQRAEGPKEQIRALIEGHIGWAREAPEQVMVMMLFYFQAMRDPRFAELHGKIREIGAQRIQALIQLGLGLPAASARASAKNIQALITGHLIDNFSTGGLTSLDSIREYLLDEMEAIWRRGARKPRAPVVITERKPKIVPQPAVQ